ncbi:regulatory protein viviparous-1-like isoform X2 [Phalaenopsis equestris]|uniref:regulatory protein viviparous-1-like isoform X2 n=1 Tax=Phalaenopsis equestris TaxID=78828 RepID=UPI0009E372F6|nr:regulatory protein viviparous-1-like isoform X2 [Phalaenopsis equestris]
MGDREMELDGGGSSSKGDKVVESAGGEEKGAPALSPVEDMMIDVEETDERLFFSDEDDTFPSLSDFACLSSPSAASATFSSAASTLPKPSNSSSSSSSSFSSSSPWSFLLAETEGKQPPAAASEDPLAPAMDAGFDILGDEIDLWESCMDPIESSTWDSSPSFFPNGREFPAGGGSSSREADPQASNKEKMGSLFAGDDGNFSEDLANVFLDWLKRNKDSISPEDLRSIKLKRSTIECAARRLGGGQQGRVQLLKLILSWVQNHHLQKKRRRTRGSEAAGRDQELTNHPLPPPPIPPPPPQIATISNPNIDLYYDALPSNTWVPYAGEPSYPPVMPGYRDEAVPPYNYYNNQAFTAQPWQQGFSTPSTSSVIHYSQMPLPVPMPAQAPALAPPPVQYVQNLPVYYTGHMASATKEARKKRMARHRKSSSFHHHRSQQVQNQQQQSLDTSVATDHESSSAHSNFNKENSTSLLSSLPADIPSSSSSSASAPAMLRMQEENHPHKRTASPASERLREGIKSENNYKFLLRKVLKQSDVGSLGRIVLPKKEAEIHLPVLDTRDGISIEMEDIGASRVWNMRYRFWPNNKSRMYLLENTGDFVKANGLQEGDFIVIYSDAKSGKYMIRGVKVRQPAEAMKGASNRSSGKAANHKKEKSSSTMAAAVAGSHLQDVDYKGKSLYTLPN